jgi:hypothetical protein
MRAARLLSSGLSQKIRKSFFSACCAPKPAQKRCFLIVFARRCCELFRAHAGGSTAGSGIVAAGLHRPMPFSGLPCTRPRTGRFGSPPTVPFRRLHYITWLVQVARRDPGRAACGARRACTDSAGSAATWTVCNTAFSIGAGPSLPAPAACPEAALSAPPALSSELASMLLIRFTHHGHIYYQYCFVARYK